MLVKWMLAFGLQGTALITIAPVARATRMAPQPPTTIVKPILRQPLGDVSAELSLLDSGFRSMYDLDFSSAQQQFLDYEHENPTDPMGPVAEAARLLFSEFSRLGVLRSQMFIKDPSFASRSNLVADPAVLRMFDLAIQRSQASAEKRLAGDGNDRDALLALAFAAGLRAENLALIQNQSLVALQYARVATSYAQRLLAVCPECFGAYLATAGGGYWIGSRTVPVRWILRARALAGNKGEGIKEMQIVAQHSHYLAPFAEILLTIAYLRDKEPQQARRLLAELRAEIPENTPFAGQLERLGGAAETEAGSMG